MYDADGTISRGLSLKKIISVDSGMVAETIQLTAFVLRGYTLTMTLISADRIE